MTDRIDTALAAPEPDAMEIADKIREMSISYSGFESFDLSYDDAAALIEQYGRRVPRAMLDEIWLNGYKCQQGKKNTDMADIAAKYGVKIEEEEK